MRHFRKRALALLLALMLCLSLFPSALAEDAGSITAAEDAPEQEVTIAPEEEGDIIPAEEGSIAPADEGSIRPAEERDILSRTDEPQASETSGPCGENLSWSFDEATGTFAITGSGFMWDWSYNTVPWYSLCDSIKSVELPSGLTGIGNYAFSGCSRLTEVEIPAGVISIGDAAFHGCTGLTSVTIPTGVTSIGNSAFGSCTGLTAVDIPAAVTSIGVAAFYNCRGLTGVRIPEGVVSIGENAFGSCSGLVSIAIPASATEIDQYALENSTSLRDIYYGGTCDAWREIYPIYDYASVTVHCTDGIWEPNTNPNRCGTNLFWSLENRVLSITGTGDMWDYTLNHETRTPPWYSQNNQISRVHLSEGITSIGNYAFYGCTGLVGEVTIPEGVTRIGDSAFYYCNDGGSSDLSILLPESLRTIGRDAFHACCAARISIPGGIQKGGGAFWGITDARRIDFGGTRQAWLELDPEYNFYFSSVFCTDGTIERKNKASCGDDLTWDLDNSGLLTVAGAGDMWNFINMDGHGYTFSNAPWSGVSPAISLRKVLLPAGLTHMGNLAFYGNSRSLSEIRFTGPAPSFGESAFFGVSATVYYPANDPSWTEDVRQSYRGRISWVGYVPGDANGDGTPDLLDLVRLRKELAGLSPELDITAADLSGNWEIDAQDLVLLRKLLVGEAS